jgi:hypothetical protein
VTPDRTINIVSPKTNPKASCTRSRSLLQLNGPATAGWLAEMTGLTTGAVTGMIDRLERAGYVRREPDPHDRRRVIVTPDLGRWDRDLQGHAPNRAPASLQFLLDYSPAQLRATRRFVADLAAAPPG